LRKSIGAMLFFEKIEDFFQKNSVAPEQNLLPDF
jgi:hypothetical protein